ncbi:MAG: hypothetical protein IGS39_21700 [Calothrix sp. C42_A2020_038]|nr:hypothetical protein [Calothrix sp. C42_A2020_038]
MLNQKLDIAIGAFVLKQGGFNLCGATVYPSKGLRTAFPPRLRNRYLKLLDIEIKVH